MERILSRHLATLALGIAAAVLCASAAAQTPPCGTVLTQSVRLNADMYCPLAQPALVVGADNVRVDLNGFGIVALTSYVWPIFWNAPAIVAQGRKNVEVVGPGRIMYYLYDVRIVGGRDHLVAGITGSSLLGIFLGGTSDSQVRDNELAYGVRIRDDEGAPTFTAVGPATRNQLVGNRVGTAALRAGVVALHGCLAGKNTVSGNQIFGSVRLGEGASNNIVQGNRISSSATITSSAVSFGEAFANELRDNVIDADGGVAISIQPEEWPRCSTGGQPGRNGDDNLIYANIIQNGSTGLRVGTIPASAWTLGTGNVILGNTFMDMTVNGQQFGIATANNDGRNNKYLNVPVEVQDLGTGNLWP